MKTISMLWLAALATIKVLGAEHFYVTDNQGTVGNPGTFISIVDVTTNKVIGYVNSNGFDLTHPIDIHFSQSGDKAYITSDAANSVFVVNVLLNQVVGTVDDTLNPFNAPVVFDISFSANMAYVANEAGGVGNQGSISIVDLAVDQVTGKVDDSLFPVNLPIGVGFSDDGTQALVCNLNGHSVGIIDTATHTITANVDDSLNPFVQPLFPLWSGSTKAYVSDLNNSMGGFVNIVVGGAVVGTVSTGIFPPFAGPVNMAEGPDGTIYIGDVFNNNVYVMNPLTNAVTHIFTGTFSYPLGIAITPDNTTAYVANFTNNTVSIVSLSTYTQTAIVNATSFPFFGPYQMQLTGSVPPAPPPPSSPLRPICIHGKQKTVQFASQSELLNSIQWCPSPTLAVTKYNLYRNGILFETISASSLLTFEEHDVIKGVITEYSVTAVNSSGIESPAVTITLP